MSNFDFKALKINDSIPSLTIEAITRKTLALYAGAGGDHNPIHIDIDFAKSAGYDDVFAHGMLIMAYLGRQVTDAIPPQRLKKYSARFKGITQVGDTLSCSGQVQEIVDSPDGRQAKLILQVVDSEGSVKIAAEAVIDISE